MADAEFSFSTKQVAQQVDSATKSLDLLVQKMKELDKTSLNQMQRELNNLKQNGPEAIKGMVAGMKGSVREMKALLEEGLVAPMKSSRFREAFNGYSEQFRAMTKRVESIQQANTAKMLAEEEEKNIRMLAEQKKANIKRLAEQARAMNVTMNNASGDFMRYNPETGAKGSLVKHTAEVNDVNKAYKSLTVSGNDLHSMARGLASGFNLLWLTWGNLVPLFIGAAISNGFMQTVKTGMEVAHTFEIIGALGGATAQEMGALTNEMIRLGTSGVHGPKEIAEAMKTLTLAGLKANEVLAVTQTVLNFSVAGTTSLQTSAETLVSITTAFGTGAAGFGNAADIIVRAAADSKSSVESFGEALKTASVVGEQFGASLTDVAVQVEVLAQLGIQGSAAGTSIRNFYTDISGRTPKVVNALKAVNVEFRDLATGNVKPLIENVKQLSDVMSTLTPVGGKNWLATVFSERGGKDAVALIVEYRKQIKDADGVTLAWSETNNALAERLRAVENAAGDSAIAAARLAQTSKSEFAKVGSTLQTTLFDAFKAIEPQLTVIFEGMRAAFASPEFLSALTMMTSSIATLGKFLVDHSSLIIGVAAAYGLMKVAVLADIAVGTLATAAKVRWTAATSAASTALVGNTGALEINTAATTANNTATAAGGAAAAGKGAALLGIARFMPGLNALIIAGTIAWLAYEFITKKSSSVDEEAAAIREGAVSRSLVTEAEKIEALNAKRREGLTLSEAQLALDKEKAGREASDELNPRLKAATEELTKAEQALTRFKIASSEPLGYARAGGSPTSVARAAEELKLQEGINAAARVRSGILREQGLAVAKTALDGERIRNARREENAFIRKDAAIAAAENQAAIKALTSEAGKGFQQQDFAGGKGAPGSNEWAENFRINSDNALKEIEKRYNSETELSRKLNTTKQNENKALMEAGLITLGDYQAKELSMAKESEAAQLQGIANVRKAHAEEHQKRITWVEGLKAAWEKANAGKKGFDAKTDATAKTFEAELKKLREEAETFGQKLDDAEVSLKDAVAGRIRLAAIAVGKPIQELAVEMKKFDDEQGRRSEKQIRDQQLAIDSLTMTPKQIASVKAYNDELEYTNAQTDKMADKLSEIEKSYAAYIEAVSANSVEGPWNPDQLEAAEKYQEQIKKLTDELKKYQEQGGLNATTAGNRASTLFDKSESQKTIKDVASAITDGLFKGGKEGSKKLRETVTDKLKEPINLAINAALNVATNYVQGLLSGGGSSSESGGGSSGGGLGGLISTGNGIWNAFSGSTVGSMASGVAKVGTLLGSSAMTAFGNAALGTSLGLGGASSAAAASAASAAAGGAAAGGAASLGSMAAAAGPWVAGIAAVYTLAKKFDKSGTAHVGGLAQYSATGGLKTSQRHGDFGMGFGGVDYNEGISSMVSGVAQSITGLLDSTALAFGKTAGYTVATAFADDSSRDGAWGGLVISKLGTELLDWADTRSSKWAPKVFADGEAGSKQYLAAISQSVMGVIKGMDLPGWAIGMLDNLGAAPSLEQLATVMDQINQTHAALKVMGETLVGFAGMTDRTTAALIAASGGISNLAANANKYYENFYSEAEKQANASKQVANAMASVNLQMPTTREGYRALVEQYTAMGEAGASTVAVLLGLSGAFASVVPAATGIGNLSEALEKLRNPLRSIEDIANNIISLEDELFALQNEGNTAALRAKELAGLTDTERAIKLQIYALQDQKEALEKVADAAQEAINVQEAYANSMSSAGSGIADLIRELTTTQGGTAGPMQTMRQAQANYLKDLSLARQGDVSASERIAQSAREYIDASGAVSMNSTQAAINAQVVSELKALPATRTYEQKMLDELVKITDLTLQQLSAQNITNTTLANFGTFDINLDGLLTFEELKIALEGKASDAELRAMFQMMDANGDGTISQLELVRNNTAVGAQASQELNAQYIGQSLSLQSQTNASMAEIAASQVKQAFEMSEQRKALDQLLWMATYNYLLGTPHMPMIVTSYMQWVGRTQGNGNGFDQTPMVRFAQGGVFTNSIVDRPTNFSMGQMGEAGPEAIMPLERGSDGSLGVRMYGEGPYATVDFGGMSEALVAMSVQLAKVSAELAEIKRATTATAAHTAGTKDAVQLQNRNGVQVWSDPKEPLQVEAV